jgi:alkanesulfonate monooxygenase SsuD/methylene tetrahydromethanopterin reductase-like flavin-dependent oxidoreductase (luciferase family)
MSVTHEAAPRRLSVRSGNKLKLGLFGANCSSGRNLTTVPERWRADWQQTVHMAQIADESGIDFLLPIGRWKGYGGETDFQGTTFETLTWASGLLAKTKRITVFGTVHTPLFHPIIAAKQMVTADHIGEGRLGLNIVCGWNEDEFEMFGIPQKEHGGRYEHGQEWIDLVKMMWEREDTFDFDGAYFQLRGVRSKPKPYGGTRPVIMNAGASTEGQAFAIRNCDAFFTGIRVSSVDEGTGIITPDMEQARRHVADVRARAAALGREIGVFTRAEVVCRPTQREAREYYRYSVEEHVDWAAVDHQLELTGVKGRLDPAAYAERRKQHVRGFPLIGDPGQVSRMLLQLGEIFDGVAISLLNYLDELPLLCEGVLPRLERAGVRSP